MLLRRGALLFFKVICQISRSHGWKKSSNLNQIGRFRTVNQFEYTNGYEIMHKVWSSIEKVPYCFSRSSVKFQGHAGQKTTTILTQIERFQTIALTWIHWWLWNDAQSLKQHRSGALLLFKVICQISRSHGTKNCQFWPELKVSGL